MVQFLPAVSLQGAADGLQQRLILLQIFQVKIRAQILCQPQSFPMLLQRLLDAKPDFVRYRIVPLGIGKSGHSLRREIHGQPLQPLLRERLALGKMIQPEHQPVKSLIPPLAAAEGIRETQELLIAFLIFLLEQLLQHVLLHQPELFLACHAESGIQVDFREVSAKDGLAKGVNGRDGSARKQNDLPIQTGKLVRIPLLCHLLHERRLDAFLHLLCCRMGKGNDQQFVHIALACKNHRNDPLHEHSRLAGTGSRRDQEILFSRIDRSLLLLRPIALCHHCLSFPCSSSGCCLMAMPSMISSSPSFLISRHA